jgi:carbon storage regulator
MLVVSRNVNDSIVIGDDIVVTIVEIRGDRVRLGITAPAEAPVHRREVFEALRHFEMAPSRPPAELPEPPPWRPDVSRG